MKRHTLVPSPTTLLHSVACDKWPGKQSKRYHANFARWTPVWRNPAHVGLWRCVHCAKNSATQTKPGTPMLGLEDDKGKFTLFYCCFGHYRILAYKISACEVSMIWRKPTEAFKINCQIAESRTGKAAMAPLKIQLDCFTVHDTTPLGEHICAQPFRMWNRHIFIRFCRSHKYFKDAKAMQINKTWK